MVPSPGWCPFEISLAFLTGVRLLSPSPVMIGYEIARDIFPDLSNVPLDARVRGCPFLDTHEFAVFVRTPRQPLA